MRRQGRSGFTLVELMISLTMLGIIMGGVVSTVLSMQRGYVRQREVARTEDALRVAERTISMILRGATSNPLNMLVTNPDRPRLLPDPQGNNAFDNLRVVSDFNPADGDTADPLEDIEVWTDSDTLFVRWQTGGANAAVAFPVRSLLFQYDSNGTALTTATNVTRAANRVRVAIEAPRHSQTNVIARRVMWVYVRNR